MNMQIIIVEESLKRTHEEALVILSQQLREFLDERGIKLFVIDRDIKNGTDKCPERFRPFIEAIKSSALPIVLFIDNNLIRSIKPLPKTVDEFINLIKEKINESNSNKR